MQKKQFYIFLIICALLLINNWSIPLWDQDEAAYAGFGYTMCESGNWLVPNFMYSDVHRKPPLHFWNIAISYKLFGYNEFAVRFPSFLAVLGTFLLMFFQGKKFLGQTYAFKGLMVIAGSFLVTAIAKISVTDATVLFTSTLCAFGIINTLRNPSWQWIFLFWLGFALGTLTKGPPIIIFSISFIALLAFLHPLRKNLLKLRPLFFLPFALVPLFLWGYLTYLNDGGVFLSWMYDWYIVKRINGNVFGQTAPIGTHIVAISIFFLSFFAYIPRALVAVTKKMLQKEEASVILVAWFVAGWFLYEFSPSKLPAYVIVAHVPFAFIIALYLENGIPFKTKFDKIFTGFHFFIQFVAAIGLCIVPAILNFPSGVCVSAFVVGLFLLFITIFIIVKRNHPSLSRYQLIFTILFVLASWSVVPQISQLINSSKRVADVIEKKVSPMGHVFIGRNYGNQPSLPFYLLNKGFTITDATYFTNEQLFEASKTKQLNIFVLSNEQYNYFCEQTSNKIKSEMVSTLIIDRVQKSDYYIVSSRDIPNNFAQ
ncbi:MAG: glycosyltransferase family 39 protein [Bacteroidota bacterium]